MPIRSGVAWLSSSGAEISRARHVLKALAQSGVLDELGFLALQGAFADHLYPAVTTPMTRARYLIFVPAVYQWLEQSGKAVGKDVDRLSRDLQYEVLKALPSAEPGAIGRESGRNIVRPPSEIYWNALSALGIATERISESTYQRRLSAGEYRSKGWRDDDKAAHAEDAESLWNPSLRLSHVMPGGVCAEATDLRLRKSEALFLQKRYAELKPGGHDTLITHLVSLVRATQVHDIEAIEYPWEVPALPPETAEALRHARLLSLFARGVTLQYHRMLIEKRRDADPGAAEAFNAWWDCAQGDLANWKLDDFFALLRKWEANRRPVQDREFLERWIQRCVSSKSGKQALEDPIARAVVSRREDQMRPGKQRLRVKHQLDSWRLVAAYPVDEFYQLLYRHPVGRQFAQDIADGLERGA